MQLPLALALSLSLIQAPVVSEPPKQPPVFAAKADLVLVDFVVSRDGDASVSGLTAKDFVVKEDGKERPILSFAAFAPGERPNIAGTPDAAGATSAASEAADALQVFTVVIVDDLHLTPQNGLSMRPALKQLLRKLGETSTALGLVAPASEVTLAASSDDQNGLLEAGADRIVGKLLPSRDSFQVSDAEAFAVEQGQDPTVMARLIARFIGLNPRMDPKMVEVMIPSRAREVAHGARVNIQDVQATVIRSLDWLAKKPGRHSIVFVSGGFAYDPQNTLQRTVVNSSLRANAPIHFVNASSFGGATSYRGVDNRDPIEAAGMEAVGAEREGTDGTLALASDTGGLTLRLTDPNGVARLLGSMTTYYLIGYEPPLQKKKGFRKVSVEPLDKKLKVLARRGYFDEGQDARKAK